MLMSREWSGWLNKMSWKKQVQSEEQQAKPRHWGAYIFSVPTQVEMGAKMAPGEVEKGMGA